MKTHKICKKGTGKALGFQGCKTERQVALYNKSNFKYGLGIDCGCFAKWLRSSDEGLELMQKSILRGKKIVKTEKDKEFKQKKRDLNEKGAMDLADKYFSRYIRVKHSVNDLCTCYTCGKDYHVKELDNGHYQKREHKATRYHENNCRPQCKTCNGDTKHNGKQAEFRVNLVNEIGEEMVSKIERLARSIFKVNTKFYRDTADYYRIKVNELQKKLGVKYW